MTVLTQERLKEVLDYNPETGKDVENRILREHFKQLRVNFEKLAEQFGVDEVANCRAFKLQRLELRLALGA